MTARRIGGELAFVGLGIVVALGVLRWLHEEWLLPAAIVSALLGPTTLRMLLRGGVADWGRPSGAAPLRDPLPSAQGGTPVPAFGLPPFLLGLLDGLAGTIGLLLACWSTMLTHHFAYWVLRWQEASALLLSTLLLAGSLVALIYTHGRMAAEIEAREARLAALREAALQAQLRALQAQINPHFLFNALNILAELTHQDPDATERLVTDLAWLLRYTLKSSAEGRVPLRQELEAIERYLRIEQARLGARLVVDIDVEPALLDLEIPGLVLQPLVENAVKYAAATTSSQAVVSVEGERDGDQLVLRVSDNGPGLPPEVAARLVRSAVPSIARAGPAGAGTGGAGGGLANVQQRLALTYRGDARITAEPTDEGTCLRLELPA